MNVGELWIQLGFDVDDGKLKSFNDGIKSSMTDLLKLTGIAAGAVYSVNRFIESSLHNSTALRQFTAETGESTEALQKWQVAAQLANTEMSVDDVTAAFKRMSSAMSEARYDGSKGGVFAQLGIENVQQKTSAELLNELRQNFQNNIGRWGLPKTLDFMEQLGVPKSMARTFGMSDEDIDRMTRGLTITDEQNKKITDLADTIRRATIQFQHWRDVITAEYSDEMIVFVERASDAIDGFFKNMSSFTSHAPEFSGGLKLIAGSAALLVAALNPITATIIGLVSLFNDIGAYARGEPSVIGDAVDFAKGIGSGPVPDLNKRTTLEESLGNWKSYLGMGSSGGVTQNNTYNIQSLADPKDVAREVTATQQNDLNRAYSQLNRGGF